MEIYLKKLHDYVVAHPPNFRATDVDSILEAIYWVYSESNSMDNDAIRADLEMLYSTMHSHSTYEIERVTDVVCSLCEEYKRAGFSEGVKIGVRLEQELIK